MWRLGPVLDQGREGACVGFGYTADLLAEPYPAEVTTTRGNAYAREYYLRARQIDAERFGAESQWEGSTMLSGARVAVERGLYDGYLWADDIEDVRNAVVSVGPVIVGIPWSGVMSGPGAKYDNWLKVDRAGTITSYHCILVAGYDPARPVQINGVETTRPMFYLRNSWGPDFGTVWYQKWVRGWSNRRRKHVRRRKWDTRSDGGAWIMADDLDWLLSQSNYSESACLPVGRRPVSL